MPVRLDWRVGSPGEGEVLASGTVDEREARRLRRSPLTPMLVGAYLVALAVAGWVGFNIGRWTELRADDLHSITNQLEVERVAWQTGDLELYQSTLDPKGRPSANAVLVAHFKNAAPSAVDWRLGPVEMVRPDLARVTLDLALAGANPKHEERYYRLLGHTWYRTATPRAAN